MISRRPFGTGTKPPDCTILWRHSNFQARMQELKEKVGLHLEMPSVQQWFTAWTVRSAEALRGVVTQHCCLAAHRKDSY